MDILICGRSRAGKTTFSQFFDDVIHLDDYPPLTRFDDVLDVVRETGPDVVIDGVYNKRERLALLEVLRAQVKVCVFIDTPVEIIQSRHRLGRVERFTPPDTSEGWDAVITISIIEYKEVIK